MVTNPEQVRCQTHQPIERVLAIALRIGSVITALLLISGIAAMFLGRSQLAVKMITAGIMVLIATPIMRVLVAGIIFIRDKDWRFAFFCLVVLCLLAVGMTMGNAG